MLGAIIVVTVIWSSAYLPLRKAKDKDGLRLVHYCLLGSVLYGVVYNHNEWAENMTVAINSSLWFLGVFGSLVTACIQIRLMTNKEDEEDTTEPYDTLIED